MPQSLGTDTARTVFLATEMEKLHLEFKVSNGPIYRGQPVYLHTDGTIRPYTAAVGILQPILGYAIHKAVTDANCTVIVSGYAVLYAFVKGNTGGGLTGTPDFTVSGMAKYDSFTAVGTEEYSMLVSATMMGTLTVSGALTTTVATCQYQGLVLDVPTAPAILYRYLVVPH